MSESASGAAEAVAPADDLRADLEASFETAAPETTDTPAERPERDAQGKFAGNAQDAPTESAGAGEKQEGGSEPAETDKRPERSAGPADWPSDARFQWDKLHPTARTALEADLAAWRQSIGAAAKGETAPDAVREVVRAYEGQYKAKGLSEEGAVKALFEAQRYLDADPVEGLKWLAREYGVSLNNLSPQTQGSPDQNPVVARLEQELAQVKGYLTQQQRTQHDAAMAETQRSIETFSTEKAADGQPLRPYFADVRTKMGKLLENGTAVDLQDAYDQAVYSTPAIRQKVMEAERKATAARDDAARKAAVDEAKRKSGSVRSNPSVQAAVVAPDDLRTALSNAWDGAS